MSTNALPTTIPSAKSLTDEAVNPSFIPKPITTGNSVKPLKIPTFSLTSSALIELAPVIPLREI